MRKFLTKYIKDSIFVHCDMWGERFPMDDSVKVLDFDLAEQTAINAVTGMYLNGKTIYVYGVAGFMIHQMEQIKYSILTTVKNYPNNGKIIFVNAGKVGYEKFTEPHKLIDDIELMYHYCIPVFDPNTLYELKNSLEKINNGDIEVSYIRLGRDF
jgi:transketolase C-terminal domain/subunit